MCFKDCYITTYVFVFFFFSFFWFKLTYLNAVINNLKGTTTIDPSVEFCYLNGRKSTRKVVR